MKKGQVNIGYKGRRIAFNNTEKLVGQAIRYTTIAYAAIVAYAAKAAGVTESSIALAMEALFDAVNYFVLNGHSVQIPNLGTFSLCVSVKTSASEAEFTSNFAQNLRRVYIRFLPDPELKAMIASTSINTMVDDGGYTSEGIISVNSALFGQGSVLVPMNAGRAYALDRLTRMVFNGTRLTKTYLGATPLRVTVMDDAGVETSVRPAGTMLSDSYNSLTFDIKEFKKGHSEAKYIKSFTLSDADGNVIIERSFAGIPADPYISAVTVDNVPAAIGATMPYVEGEAVKVKIFGCRLADATEVKVGTIDLVRGAASDTQIIGTFIPPASGNYPVSVKSDTSEASVYNLSFGQEAGVSVASVTANGDALLNGGSTNITDGSNYLIAIAGQGLDTLTADNFELPAGSSISITSQSATQINASLQSAHAGDFKIKVDDVQIFAAVLVVVQPTVSVTGYKLTENGATQQLSVALQVDEIGSTFSVYLVGQELDDLTTDNFTGTNIADISYNPATGALSGKAMTASGSVRIAVDDTTIGTLNVVVDDNNGHPIDTGD
jgi:nucleoid DNA-binding protein